MTLHSSKFPAHSRAIWQPCLAFLMLGAFVALLAGCSTATDPLADSASDEAEGKGLQSNEEPVDLSSDAALAVTAPQYGRWQMTSDDDPVIISVMPGLPIQFYWQAVDVTPLGNALSYRYGWNVVDPDDPDDPGWYGPPRSGYKSQQTQAIEIWDGVHDLTIECWDGDTLLVRVVIEVYGMPVEPAAMTRY